MDIFDLGWNLFRKALGTRLYTTLRKSPLGRPGTYFSLPTFKCIFDRYRSNGFDFTGKHILEVGGGRQFYTAGLFLSAGAKDVTLVDPVFAQPGIENDTLIREHFSSLQATCHTGSSLRNDRIHCYPSLDGLVATSSHRFDFIGSHFALEHFRDLDNFFSSAAGLLSSGGTTINFVDLSDHAYHLFNSRPLTRKLYLQRQLYHLRYSDALYNAITDPRIWVNRALLPTYRELARRHRFSIRHLATTTCQPTIIHPDVIRANKVIHVADLYVTHFTLQLVRNNTFRNFSK